MGRKTESRGGKKKWKKTRKERVREIDAGNGFRITLLVLTMMLIKLPKIFSIIIIIIIILIITMTVIIITTIIVIIALLIQND